MRISGTKEDVDFCHVFSYSDGHVFQYGYTKTRPLDYTLSQTFDCIKCGVSVSYKRLKLHSMFHENLSEASMVPSFVEFTEHKSARVVLPAGL